MLCHNEIIEGKKKRDHHGIKFRRVGEEYHNKRTQIQEGQVNSSVTKKRLKVKIGKSLISSFKLSYKVKTKSYYWYF